MFLEVLDHNIAAHAGEAALIAADRIITHSRLDEEIRSLTSWLARAGVEQGQVVGLTVRDEHRHLVAALALMRLGCIQVTLPTHEPEEHRSVIASRTNASLVVADKAEHALPDVETLVADFDYRAGRIDLPPPASPETPCIYITSSGTTGHIKIAPLSQNQLYHQAMTWQWPAQREVFYRPAPIEFNNSKKQRLFNLVWATTNVFADAGRVDFFETCRKFDVTRLNLSSVHARAMIEQAAGQARPLSPACHIRLGGSAIPASLRRELIDTVTPNIHVTYATSEFASISTAGPEHNKHDLDTVGSVHPGIELQVVGNDGKVVPPGRSGRIRVRSQGMATHYHGDDAATAEAFGDGWFHPGDIGRITSDGLVYLEGRSDDMMILASINIFPAEIEEVVDTFPGVIECAAFSLKSESLGDIPMVAVVASDNLVPSQLQKFTRQKLGLRAPRKVVLIDALPRKAGTKIDRRALQRRFTKTG